MRRKKDRRNRKNRSPDPQEHNRPQKLRSVKEENVKRKEPKCSTKKKDKVKKGSKSSVNACEKDNEKLPGRSGSSLRKKKCKKEVTTTSLRDIKKNKKKDDKKTSDKIKKEAKTEFYSVTPSESNIKSCSPSLKNLDDRRPEVDITNVGCQSQDIPIINVSCHLRTINTIDINSNRDKENIDQVPLTPQQNQNLIQTVKRKWKEGSNAPLCIDVFQNLTPKCNENTFVNTQLSNITNDFSNLKIESSETTRTDDQPCSHKSHTKPKFEFEQVNKLCASFAELQTSNVQSKARNASGKKMSETKFLVLKDCVKYFDLSNSDWEMIDDEKNDFWIVNGEEHVENIISPKTSPNGSIGSDKRAVIVLKSENMGRKGTTETGALIKQTQEKQCTEPKFSNVIQGRAMHEKSKNDPIKLALKNNTIENRGNNNRTAVTHICTSMNGTNHKSDNRIASDSPAITDNRNTGSVLESVDNSNTDYELDTSSSEDSTCDYIVRKKIKYDFYPYYIPLYAAKKTDKSFNTDLLTERQQNKSKEYSNSPTSKKCTKGTSPMTDVLSNSRSENNFSKERKNIYHNSVTTINVDNKYNNITIPNIRDKTAHKACQTKCSVGVKEILIRTISENSIDNTIHNAKVPLELFSSAEKFLPNKTANVSANSEPVLTCTNSPTDCAKGMTPVLHTSRKGKNSSTPMLRDTSIPCCSDGTDSKTRHKILKMRQNLSRRWSHIIPPNRTQRSYKNESKTKERVFQEININSSLPRIDADPYSTPYSTMETNVYSFGKTCIPSKKDLPSDKLNANKSSSPKRSYDETITMSPSSPPESYMVQQHVVCDDFPKESFFEDELYPPNDSGTNEEISKSEVHHFSSVFHNKYLADSNSSMDYINGNCDTPFIPKRAIRSSPREEIINSTQGTNCAHTSDCGCDHIRIFIPKGEMCNRISRNTTAHTLPHKSHEHAQQNDQTKTKLKHSTSPPHEMHTSQEACEYNTGYINNFSTNDKVMTPVFKIYEQQDGKKEINSNGGRSVNYMNTTNKSNFSNFESATPNQTSLPLFLRPSKSCPENNILSDCFNVKYQYEYGDNKHIVFKPCFTDGQNPNASEPHTEFHGHESFEDEPISPENETDPYAPVFIKPSVTITRCKKSPTPRKPTKEELFRDPNFIFDLDWKDDTDTTPMHWAAFRGHLNIVNNLIDEGVRLNVQDNSGWTPLHMAVMQGHTDCVETLLKANANPCIVDRESRSPLDLAKLLQKTNIVNILYRYVNNYDIIHVYTRKRDD